MLPKDKAVVPISTSLRFPPDRVIFYIDHVVAYGDVITCQVGAKLEGSGWMQMSAPQSMSFHRSMWPPKLEQIQLRFARQGNTFTPDEIVISPIMNDKTEQWMAV